MGGIDAERAEAADQVGRDRHPDEHHHDEEAERAQHVALREEREPSPAMRRMGPGALQLAIVIDYSQTTGLPSVQRQARCTSPACGGDRIASNDAMRVGALSTR